MPKVHCIVNTRHSMRDDVQSSKLRLPLLSVQQVPWHTEYWLLLTGIDLNFSLISPYTHNNITKPTVTNHWTKLKALTKPVAWPHPFFIYHWTPKGRSTAPLSGPLTPVPTQIWYYKYFYLLHIHTNIFFLKSMILRLVQHTHCPNQYCF